jgi:hypothetical protein
LALRDLRGKLGCAFAPRSLKISREEGNEVQLSGIANAAASLRTPKGSKLLKAIS